MKTRLITLFLIEIFTLGFFSLLVPQIEATATPEKKVSVTFMIAGVGNYNKDIITINGHSYTKNNIHTKSYFPGSTISVSVVEEVTEVEWYPDTFRFSSWTNGNGLTGSSGTFTVPSSDTTIIANYGSSPALETVLTVSCTLDSVSGGTAAIISGGLSSCSSGIASKSIVLIYYDGANWNSIGSSVTSSDGTYSYNWIVPEDLENGVYPVKAEFQGDTEYLSSSAVTGSAGSLMVVPEFPLGGLVALLACFSSAFIFIKLRSKANCYF